MRLAGATLLFTAAALSMSAAPPPTPSDRVIRAVLEDFARDTTAGTRDCVRTRLERLDPVHKKDRATWGAWWASRETTLPLAAARQIDRLLFRAAAARPSDRIAGVTHIPKSMIATAEDEPKTGPCALGGREVEVWHHSVSRPLFNGGWAFIEVNALALGKYPPPQLWAVKLEQGQWRPKYYAMRTVWYD